MGIADRRRAPYPTDVIKGRQAEPASYDTKHS
jgi:hypothetical protein